MSLKKLTKDELKKISKSSKKPRKKKKVSNPEYYVDSKVFENQILQYYKDEQITTDLGDAIHNIATRLGFASNFINYTYKEEMVGDAKIKMFHA